VEFVRRSRWKEAKLVNTRPTYKRYIEKTIYMFRSSHSRARTG